MDKNLNLYSADNQVYLQPLVRMIKQLKVWAIILMASCTSPNPELRKEPVIEDGGDEYVDLLPVDSNGINHTYDLHGFKFELTKGWKIQEMNGPDFVVSTLLSPSGSRFACYFGWHPSYPWPINDYTNTRLRSDYLDIRNHDNSIDDFSLEIEASIEDGIHSDSSIKYRKDSMLFELHNLQDREVWVRRPYSQASGPIDIGVIFRSDSVNTKLHLFGEISSPQESEKLIEIAKGLK